MAAQIGGFGGQLKIFKCNWLVTPHLEDLGERGITAKIRDFYLNVVKKWGPFQKIEFKMGVMFLDLLSFTISFLLSGPFKWCDTSQVKDIYSDSRSTTLIQRGHCMNILPS